MPLILTSRIPWHRRPSGPISINRASPLSLDLLGVWTPSGSTGMFASPLSTDGAVPVMTWWDGPALDFSGSNLGYVPIASRQHFVTPWTVAAWVRADATTDDARAVAFTTNSQNPILALQITSGAWDLWTRSDTDVTHSTPQSSAVVVGRWTLLVARSFSTSAVALSLAVDGRPVDSLDVATAPSPLTSTFLSLAGIWRGFPAAWLDCAVASVQYWNRALSDAEIWALYDPRTRWELYQPLVKRSYFDMAGGAPPANVEGTGSLTAGSATLSATGTLRVTATASVTATAATTSATGTQTHRATSALTAGAATLSATATQTHRATSTLTAGAATVAASGSVGNAITGTAALTATVATLDATGAQTHRATSDLTAAPATLSATGTVASGAVTGTSTLSATAATLAAVATQTHYATATLTASAATIWASQSAVTTSAIWLAPAVPRTWQAPPIPRTWTT